MDLDHIKIVSFSLAALLLAGCTGGDKAPIYIDSQEIAELEVPEGLDQPAMRRDYEIPGYYLPELAASRDMGLPPQVQSSVDAERSTAHIRFGAQGLHLEVEAQASSVAESLRSLLNDPAQGLSLKASDAQQQRFDFSFQHETFEIPKTGFGRLAIWRSPEVIDYSGEYQAKVVAIGEARCRVELLQANGELVDMNKAEHLLAMLRDRLG